MGSALWIVVAERSGDNALDGGEEFGLGETFLDDPPRYGIRRPLLAAVPRSRPASKAVSPLRSATAVQRAPRLAAMFLQGWRILIKV